MAVGTAVVGGRPLALTGSWDKTVRMWDLATREQVGPELVFPEPVHADTIITLRSLIGRAWTTHRWDTRPRRRP